MAVRIAGVILPNEKKIEAGLTAIYGIGSTRAKVILKSTGVDGNIRVKNLPESDVTKLREVIEKSFKVEGDLRREVLTNIKRLKEIKCYRGSRHEKHLTARGQRTKTNSRTVRGNIRRTTLSGKKPSAQKT